MALLLIFSKKVKHLLKIKKRKNCLNLQNLQKLKSIEPFKRIFLLLKLS